MVQTFRLQLELCTTSISGVYLLQKKRNSKSGLSGSAGSKLPNSNARCRNSRSPLLVCRNKIRAKKTEKSGWSSAVERVCRS